ncbi:tRNA (adenosine(37)-N6)-dimethylallyltransferase MiaA, partial [Candidatus Roizmanbacteria bacterium]|nr:tRNA (adenosine(37)-N6)-dimethylallyltransferase MiaA [Candidatus Roizmanbacteria bacterium]
RQIYKHLDIITGKDKELTTKIKVWLYDVVDPKDYFSSYDFVKLAIPLIKKILSEGKTPILVGGSYFYIKHLLYDIETEQIAPDWKLRKQLEDTSIVELQKILKTISIQSFNRLNSSDKNNPQRLIRKIEIATFRQKNPERRTTRNNQIILGRKLGLNKLKIDFIGLKFKEKGKLRETIEKRVEERLKKGAIAEVESLLAKGYKESDPGFKTIGYQQIIQYVKGKLAKEAAIEQWISKEVQYAKRQYTFMKRDLNISWKDIEN